MDIVCAWARGVCWISQTELLFVTRSTVCHKWSVLWTTV